MLRNSGRGIKSYFNGRISSTCARNECRIPRCWLDSSLTASGVRELGDGRYVGLYCPRSLTLLISCIATALKSLPRNPVRVTPFDGPQARRRYKVRLSKGARDGSQDSVARRSHRWSRVGHPTPHHVAGHAAAAEERLCFRCCNSYDKDFELILSINFLTRSSGDSRRSAKYLYF